jgi:type II secretory pathway predicted ATPase ExeA
MYYEHFGLNYPPFKITPDTQLFYSGGGRGLVLEALLYAIKNGEGIIKVVGEVGSGKTMICRMLAEKLPQDIEIVYLVNPKLSPDMILHAIALEMHLTLSPQANRLQVMHALHQHLLEKHIHHKKVVVFIEEAQGMPIETLEEIRLLSNLETTRHKLLQIVLFGQPELDTNLTAPHIRQLKERITHSFYLSSLNEKTIREYLHFRMYAVGYRGPPVFSTTAIRLLTLVSKGLIRRVNILADKALLAAFANEVHIIRPQHIQLAARDSGFNTWFIPQRVKMELLVLLIVSVLAAIWWHFSSQDTVWPALDNIIETWQDKAPEKTVTTAQNIATNSSQSIPTISPASDDLTTKPATPPATPSNANQTDSTADSLLEQRIAQTQQWLQQANRQHYTIQVMQTKIENTADLNKLLYHPEISSLLEKLYIYQITQRKQAYWEIVYAEFKEIKSATAALAQLPDLLKQNKPFLRRIGHLKKSR